MSIADILALLLSCSLCVSAHFKQQQFPNRNHSSFSRPTNASGTYLIFTENSLDITTNVNILKALRNVVVNPSQIVQFGAFRSVGGVLFWQAPLNTVNSMTMARVEGVEHVLLSQNPPLESIHDNEDPEVTDLVQRKVSNPTHSPENSGTPEMTFLSTYPATKPGRMPLFRHGDYCNSFAYDSSAGEGVIV